MATNSPKRIKSDETLFDIIELLKSQHGAGVTTISNELGLSKGTVHAHLQTLKAHGYAHNNCGEYELGIEFLDLGIYVRGQKEIYSASVLKLKELAETTQETARVAIEENGLGTFIARRSGKHSVSTDARIGRQMKLHCFSSGKAILAHLPNYQLENIIEQHGLTQRTQHTITNKEKLLSELANIRQTKLAFNQEESILGIHAVATPVFKENDVIGAISVSGAANRMPMERCQNEIGDLLLAASNEIELNLTYPAEN